MQSLFLLELNEINFEFVTNYVQAGQLPCFSKLIREAFSTPSASPSA
jgi:hypothetical protein